jgi:uncharacterized damage-inducible protein DinB
MRFTEMILPEFDHEMAITRRVLERVPDDLLDWRPHPRSNTIGWNANHIADNPGWTRTILTKPDFDQNPVDGEPHDVPKLTSCKAIVELFDNNVADARQAIEAFDDSAMNEPWSLLDAGKTLFTSTRAEALRGFIFSHMIHHRGILTVYFRLNDIPVPAIYGPSADEQ